MNDDENTRRIIGGLFQSETFALEVANLMKPPHKQYSPDDWENIAKSLPRLYAVVEAAEMSVALGHASTLVEALEEMANGPNPLDVMKILADRCARLAWQSQQPLIGQDRLRRDIMGCTSGNLPDGELEKDEVRVKATAELLLSKL